MREEWGEKLHQLCALLVLPDLTPGRDERSCFLWSFSLGIMKCCTVLICCLWVPKTRKSLKILPMSIIHRSIFLGNIFLGNYYLKKESQSVNPKVKTMAENGVLAEPARGWACPARVLLLPQCLICSSWQHSTTARTCYCQPAQSWRPSAGRGSGRTDVLESIIPSSFLPFPT